MKHAAIAAAFSLAACASAHAQSAACPPAGYDRAGLEALRAAQFEIADPRERRAFAQAVVACVASPDPFLRDQIAFESLSRMLRAGQLGVSTQTALINDVTPRLTSTEPNGVEAPFAALVLSELVRAERLNTHFTDDMRADVLERSLAYFTHVRDYRGFDEHVGWRHGVAHGADLMLQLAVSESTGRDDLIRIRDAIAAQVAPEGHFYIYGEPERLARPIIFMARRGIITEAEWTAYFGQFANREDVFSSQAGLAWRHNVNAFLNALYMNATLSGDTADNAILPGVEAAIRALP